MLNVHFFFARDRAAFLSFLAILSSSSQRALLDYVHQILVKHPVLVQERYTSDRTLLHDVAGQGSLSMVELLLHLGANPNATDKFGHSTVFQVWPTLSRKEEMRGAQWNPIFG